MGKRAYAVLAIVALLLSGGCAADPGGETGRFDNVTLTMLNCWNRELKVPENLTDNAVVNAIRDKIGVTVVMEGTTMDEEEKLNLVFASGDTPDIINAPFWSGGGGTTAIIKKAAIEGRLLPLDDAMASCENLRDAWKVGVVALPFLENDLEDPRFGGKHYILPTETPGNARNVKNWCYGVFARSDIVEHIGIPPQSVRTPDDLYRFLIRVRDGGYRDLDGGAVLPASTFHDGWDKDSFCTGFNQMNITQFRKLPDGSYTLYVLTEDWVEKHMFLRKLVQEGLLDSECFKQGDIQAWEKAERGSVGVFALQYEQIVEATQKTGLYTSNPEMRYIPLGPLAYSDGTATRVQIELAGRNGSPCSIFPVSCKNMDAALAFFDFCNSEEGLRLIGYGIENEDYVMAGGKPRLKPEDLERKRSGDVRWEEGRINRGIGIYTDRVLLADKRLDWFGETEPGGADAAAEEVERFKTLSPVEIVEGYPLDKLVLGYPRYDAYMRIAYGGDGEASAVEKAYFALSDDEAKRILTSYQDALLHAENGLIQDFLRYAARMAATRGDILL